MSGKHSLRTYDWSKLLNTVDKAKAEELALKDEEQDIPDLDEERAEKIGSADNTKQALNEAADAVDDFESHVQELLQDKHEAIAAEHRSIEQIERQRAITTKHLRQCLSLLANELRNGLQLPDKSWDEVNNEISTWVSTVTTNIAEEQAESNPESIEAKAKKKNLSTFYYTRTRTHKDAKNDIDDAEKDLDDHYEELDEHLQRLKELISSNGFSTSTLPELRNYVRRATKVEKDYHELFEALEEAEGTEFGRLKDKLDSLETFYNYIKNEDGLSDTVKEEIGALKEEIEREQAIIAEESQAIREFTKQQEQKIQEIQRMQNSIKQLVGSRSGAQN